MNATPTLTNLFKKGIQMDVTCPICKKDLETVEHAILRCVSAKEVWAKWIDCPIRILDYSLDVTDLALNLMNQGTQSDLEKFFGVAWSIWYNRNQVVNEDCGAMAEHIWGLAIRLIEDFKEANIQIINPKGTKDRAWKPPPKDVYLINVDGAIPAMEGNSEIEVIIRDWHNQVVAASCPFRADLQWKRLRQVLWSRALFLLRSWD